MPTPSTSSFDHGATETPERNIITWFFQEPLVLSWFGVLLAATSTAFAQPAPTPLSPIIVQPAPAPRPKPPVPVKSKPQSAPVTRAARRRAAPPAPVAAKAPAPAPAATPITLPDRTSSESRGIANSLQLTKPDASGSRLGLTPLQTPASVDVISRETIQERGEHNVIDAVAENATGFTANPSPGNGGIAYTARGFSGNGSVLQLLDGTRLYIGAGTVTFPFDTWSVSKIETLRGPASVLYGEGAIGGVVNVISKQPIFDRVRGEIEGAVGDFGTRRVGIDVGGPLLDPHWATRFTYSGNASNGYVDRGDFSNNTFSAALAFQPSGDFTVTLSENYGDQRPSRYLGEPLVAGQLTSALRFNNYNVVDSTLHYADNYTQLKAQWEPAPGITLENQTYYLESHRHFRDLETYALDPATALVNRSDYIEIYHTEYQVGNRLAATFRGSAFGMKNAILVGTDANDIYFKRTDNTPFPGSSTETISASNPGFFMNLTPLGTHPEFQTRTNQVSAFAEDHLDVTNQLALLVGGRFEVPDIRRTDLVAGTSLEKSFHYATYRVGAVYTPVPGLAFYGQYATGVDGQGNLISLSISNSQFSLSNGRQVEVGVKHDFLDGRGEATLAAYQIVKNNLLSVDPNTLITQQVGEQSSRGVEASASLRLFEALRVNANFAILRAKFDTFVSTVGTQPVSLAGDIPMNVPQQVGNLFAAYAFAPHWEVRAGLQYVGKIYADNANTVPLPSYAVLNAQLEWRPSVNVTLTGRIYNLLDTVYTTSAYTSTQAILGPPRTFEVALNYRF